MMNLHACVRVRARVRVRACVRARAHARQFILVFLARMVDGPAISIVLPMENGPAISSVLCSGVVSFVKKT